MVFAVWSGHPQFIREDYARAFIESTQFGMAHIDDIARDQASLRHVTEQTVRDYLTRNVVFDLGPKEHQGLSLYLKRALALDQTSLSVGVAL
jgi:predicted solute-binding protein